RPIRTRWSASTSPPTRPPAADPGELHQSLGWACDSGPRDLPARILRPMTILVTGVAGFIGFHVARALLDRGEAVIGVDIVNAYYDPALKEARLAELAGREGFRFIRADIAELDQIRAIAKEHGEE